VTGVTRHNVASGTVSRKDWRNTGAPLPAVRARACYSINSALRVAASLPAERSGPALISEPAKCRASAEAARAKNPRRIIAANTEPIGGLERRHMQGV
jgi:hypothetical protein